MEEVRATLLSSHLDCLLEILNSSLEAGAEDKDDTPQPNCLISCHWDTRDTSSSLLWFIHNILSLCCTQRCHGLAILNISLQHSHCPCHEFLHLVTHTFQQSPILFICLECSFKSQVETYLCGEKNDLCGEP